MRHLVTALFALCLTAWPAQAQEITLSAPNSAQQFSHIEVQWSGPDNPGDWIAIAYPDGKRIPYSSYVYTKDSDGTARLRMPEKPGDYAIAYYNEADEPLRVVPVTGLPAKANLAAPETVPANTEFTVAWEGPDNEGDHITMGTEGGRWIPYSSSGKTKDHPGEIVLTAPEKPGEYTVIYRTGRTVLGKAPLTVTSLDATIAAPAAVPAGSPFTAQWTGPDKEKDRVQMHDAKGDWIPYASSFRTRLNPDEGELIAPEEPGEYTLAYVTGNKSVVTTVPITVEEVTASLDAAEEVEAGLAFPVKWTGPGNRRDTVQVARDAETKIAFDSEFVANSDGDVITLIAPRETGDFELRYETPGDRKLAARPIRVVAPPQKPGTLKVLPVSQAVSLSALEVVLDASGSMLQRQGGKRRIDIAKETLSALLQDTVPAGTPFALRVFGHKEADSCRTDLEIAMKPLNTQAALATVAKIEAKNLAKTPIADSLALVRHDLSAADGEQVVILITDGEETCDGDPAAAIAALRGVTSDLRVNIVGYAIDDSDLDASFARWARLGGGAYFAAGGQDELAAALTAAAQPAFRIENEAGMVVARGLAGSESVTLPAGLYRVNYGSGAGETSIPTRVRPEAETEVALQ